MKIRNWLIVGAASIGVSVCSEGDTFSALANSAGFGRARAAEVTSSLAASGAVGDGITDDTTKINAFLGTFATGGRIRVPANKSYLLDSNNLVLPAGVILEGQSSPQSPEGAVTLLHHSGFILNPAYTITLGKGAELHSLFIQRKGLVPNPTASEVISAVAQWGQENSVGVTIPPNVGGVILSDLFIEGFNTCAKAKAGQFSMQLIAGDCFNGIDVSSAGDNHYIDNVRFEPYYALSTSPSTGSWARPGIAFNFHDGNTGTFLTRAFSLMYASGVVLSNVGVTQITNSGFEWSRIGGNGIVGTKGVRWINGNSGTSITNSYSIGYDIPLSDEGVGEVVMSGIEAPASSTTTTFNLSGESAVPSTVTIAGSASVGSIATIILTSPAIGPSPLTITYRPGESETPATVASALTKLVNARQALIAVGISAGTSSNMITLRWPQSVTVSTSVTSSGGMTSSTGIGVKQAGSYGAILGATTEGADGVHPIYTFGPNVFSWHVDTPITGDNILPDNWLSVDPKSIGRVAFTGVRWSANPLVSDCGGGGASLSENASDAAGTITAGRDAATCTLTFRTPWPWRPDCIVASTTGTRIEGYSVTASRLYIEYHRAIEGKFTYRCSL